MLVKQHGYHSYGPTDKQDNLFRKLQLVVDDDDSTCLALPAANSADTVPYLWLTLEPKAIGLPNQNSSFNLTLIGKGFGCYGKNGDQVTKVLLPLLTEQFPNSVICLWQFRFITCHFLIQSVRVVKARPWNVKAYFMNVCYKIWYEMTIHIRSFMFCTQ